MERKCKKCGKMRNVDYEFANKDDDQCVFCNDEDRDKARKIELKEKQKNDKL